MKKFFFYFITFLFFFTLFLFFLFPYEKIFENLDENLNIHISEITPTIFLNIKFYNSEIYNRNIKIYINKILIKPQLFKLLLFKKNLKLELSNVSFNKSNLIILESESVSGEFTFHSGMYFCELNTDNINLKIPETIIIFNKIRVSIDYHNNDYKIFLNSKELNGNITILNKRINLKIKFSDEFLQRNSSVIKLLPVSKFIDNEYNDSFILK